RPPGVSRTSWRRRPFSSWMSSTLSPEPTSRQRRSSEEYLSWFPCSFSASRHRSRFVDCGTRRVRRPRGGVGAFERRIIGQRRSPLKYGWRGNPSPERRLPAPSPWPSPRGRGKQRVALGGGERHGEGALGNGHRAGGRLDELAQRLAAA